MNEEQKQVARTDTERERQNTAKNITACLMSLLKICCKKKTPSVQLASKSKENTTNNK